MKLFVYACDLSQTAVDLIEGMGNVYCKAFQKNFVTQPVTEIAPNTLDFITMVFFLSAVHPDYFDQTIQKAKELLNASAPKP